VKEGQLEFGFLPSCFHSFFFLAQLITLLPFLPFLFFSSPFLGSLVVLRTENMITSKISIFLFLCLMYREFLRGKYQLNFFFRNKELRFQWKIRIGIMPEKRNACLDIVERNPFLFSLWNFV